MFSAGTKALRGGPAPLTLASLGRELTSRQLQVFRHHYAMDMQSNNLAAALHLLETWRHRARTNQKVHYDRAEALERWHRLLGVPAILLSAAVGTSIFATLKQDVEFTTRVLVGSISFVSAGLAGLQTFFKFADRAAQHHAVAAGYGAIVRAIEKAQALPPSTQEEARALLDDFEAQLNQLPKQAPAIPRRMWARVPPELTPPANETKSPSVFSRTDESRP